MDPPRESESRSVEKVRMTRMIASLFEIWKDVDILMKKYDPTSPLCFFFPEQTLLHYLFNIMRDSRANPPNDSMDIGQKKKSIGMAQIAKS